MPAEPLPMQTPVRVPSRNLAGRITGYERINGVLRNYAVEVPATRGRRFPTVWFVGIDEVVIAMEVRS